MCLNAWYIVKASDGAFYKLLILFYAVRIRGAGFGFLFGHMLCDG